ncbi:hypothetical protein [Anaerococcus tetradius]|uniref:hypothetical protein n=1 Tax=Anaerococcus tetradius TaxID=33036 RepID=UPI0023F411E4|nr:hypothetical protein [Anaerococcus tetradius]
MSKNIKKYSIISIFITGLVVIASFIIKENKFSKESLHFEERKKDTEIDSKILTDEEKEILEFLSNVSYPKGVYKYEYKMKNNSFDQYVFVSADDRSLYIDDGLYILSDGKNHYVISDNTKKYNVRKVDKGKDVDQAPNDKNEIDYRMFYDEDKNRIPELKIYKKDNNYIIETDRGYSKYDKNGILVEKSGISGGSDYVQSLVEYDKDFDKYYEDALSKINIYEKVDTSSEVSPK